MSKPTIERFESPTETREFERGRFELVEIGGLTTAEFTLEPGDLFHVPPGHDSWVVGDEPYVSLHFLGAESYAS